MYNIYILYTLVLLKGQDVKRKYFINLFTMQLLTLELHKGLYLHNRLINLGGINMSYKVTRATEAERYQAPGHFDVCTTHLQMPENVNDGTIVLGLSHFLPGGGADVAPARFEMIYYIIEGEMTLELYDDNDVQQVYVLKTGDNLHLGKGTKRGCVNTGAASAQMLTVLIKPLR